MDRQRGKSKNEVGLGVNHAEFVYPALPTTELCVYIIIIGATVIYPYYEVYLYSLRYAAKADGQWFTKGHNWLLGNTVQDTADGHWLQWNALIAKMFGCLVIHALLFNIGQLALPETVWSILLLTYWIAATAWTFGTALTLQVMALGFMLYTLAVMSGRKWVVWAAASAVLLVTVGDIFRLHLYSSWFLQLALVYYKLLQYITYCMDSIDSGSTGKKSFVKGLYEMFFYAFYFPYLVSLIVPFREFRATFSNHKTKTVPVVQITVLGLRLLFWYVVITAAYHFLYFNAMLKDLTYLEQLPVSVLCCIGSLIAEFFHMKYLLIFGLPALFAKLDGLEPPALPLCISRMVSYSQTWRNFDRGLHNFFKCYIFTPLCQPTFSVGRRLSAAAMCCLFALIRHGLKYNCLVWVLFNVLGMSLEITIDSLISKVLIPRRQQWRLSALGVRRVSALFSVLPYICKVYGHFYFFTSLEAGNIFFQKLFIHETLNLRPLAIFLLVASYCLSNMAIEFEMTTKSKPTSHEPEWEPKRGTA